jgi:hypothetical protein
MRDAGVQVKFDGNTGSAQGESVRGVLVTEDIELANFDVCRREANGVGKASRSRRWFD